MARRNSQYHNQKQKKARAKNVKDHDEKRTLSENEMLAESNPLLEQIEKLKERAVKWQEELKSKDESAKLDVKIAHLEDIAKRFDTQVKKLESTDGKTSEQIQQLGKKFAYQMGQVTDRFKELEQEISRDINANFTEMFESIEEDEAGYEEYLTDEKFDEFREELIGKLDKIENSCSNLEFPDLVQKMDQIESQVNSNSERLSEEIKDSKDNALTNEDLNQLKNELLNRIDEMESAADQITGQINISDLEIVKQEILNSISGICSETTPEIITETSEKLEFVKQEIADKIEQTVLTGNKESVEEISREIENLKQAIFEKMQGSEEDTDVFAETSEKLEFVKQEIADKIEQTVLIGNKESVDEISREIESLKQAIFEKMQGSEEDTDVFAGIEEKLNVMKQELFDYTHKECIKQYRNIQLLFDENSAPVDDEKMASDLKISEISRYSKISAGFSILVLAILIANILFQFGVFG